MQLLSPFAVKEIKAQKGYNHSKVIGLVSMEARMALNLMPCPVYDDKLSCIEPKRSSRPSYGEHLGRYGQRTKNKAGM